MSRPISLCLERLRRDGDESYVRCTATSGRESGLAIAENGDILWRDPRPCICELWVSRDQRLMARRPSGAASIRLHRGQRQLELPEDRAVVVLDRDEVRFGLEHFIIHVHGATDEIHPPQPLRVARLAAAAAVALGVGCGDADSPTALYPPPKAPFAQQGGGPASIDVGGDAALGAGGLGIALPIGEGGRGASAGSAGVAGEIEVVNSPPL